MLIIDEKVYKKKDFMFILEFIRDRIIDSCNLDYDLVEYIKIRIKNFYNCIASYDSRIVFVIIKDNNSYRVIVRDIDDTFDRDISCTSLEEIIQTMFQCLFEYNDFEKDIKNEDLSKDKFIEIKNNINMFIEDSIVLYNVSYNISEMYNHIDVLLERIVAQMLMVTKFYNTFESRSVKVSCESGYSSQKFIIRFYNGGEDKYNPTLHIHFDMNKDLLIESIKSIMDKKYKLSIKNDCSHGFINLLLNVIDATIIELNNKLKEIGFNNLLTMNKESREIMLITQSSNLNNLARLCVVRGIMDYLKIYKSNLKDYQDKWNWLLTTYI